MLFANVEVFAYYMIIMITCLAVVWSNDRFGTIPAQILDLYFRASHKVVADFVFN